MRTLALILWLAALAEGCATAQPVADNGAVGLEAIVQAARADAAGRSGRSTDALELLSAESVTWRDGSLGCPQPDVRYTMALVPGYRIRLRLGTEVFDYHASRRGALRLCPAGQAIDPLPSGRI